MSILSQTKDLQEDSSITLKQYNISTTQLPLFYKEYRRYQGTINPKLISNIQKQFESDPNTCVIKDQPIEVQNSDDSFNSNEEVETNDVTQQTIKLRYLMDKYKIKEESLLSNALVKDSVSSYVYNMNKRTIISKAFNDQSESYRRERDSLCKWSQFNLINQTKTTLKKDKEYDFHTINNKYQKRESSADDSIFLSSQKAQNKPAQSSNANGLQNYSTNQKEMNFLNQNGINEFFKKMSAKEQKEKEFLEKFRLNKTFDFGADLKSKSKSSRQAHPLNVSERYQDEIFHKLPSDIESIHKHLVEYIDMTGDGNLQPQNMIELKDDIYSALGIKESPYEQAIAVDYTKALHSDYIETFSTVAAKDQVNEMSLMTFQREISPISRQVIKDFVKPELVEEVEIIKNNEHELNMENLTGEDIFNIISGRIDKDGLQKRVEQYEQFQNKTLSNDLSIVADESQRKETEQMLNQIRAKYIKKGTEDKDSQVCIFNKDEHKIVLEKDKKDKELDSDTISVCSYLNKSQRSQDRPNNKSTSVTPSNRASIALQNGRKESATMLSSKRIDPMKRTQAQGFAPRNSINRSSLSNRSPTTKLGDRKNSNSLSAFQQQYLQAFNRKGSQAQKGDKDEPTSAISFDSEIKEQQEDLDEDQQREREQLLMQEELDALETEHNQLLKVIISVQLSPKIIPIFKEVKELRKFRKIILNTQDINEAISLTKQLNQQISSKLKEILVLLFENPSLSFEDGMKRLLQNTFKINQKQNTVEQAKLKIIFALLQQFRQSLEDNKFDNVSISKQSDPEFQIQKIQEALDVYQNKKTLSSSQKIKQEKKIFDYSKLSFYNFRTKQEKEANDSDKDDDSSSSSSVASSTVTTKTIPQVSLTERNRKTLASPASKENNSTHQESDISFSVEKRKTFQNAPKIKIGSDYISSSTSINTAANTHKSSSTTGKTFSFQKDKSTTSLNKSPSNLSQILSLSPLVPQQDSPFMGNQLEQIPELDLNNKSSFSLSSRQQPPQKAKPVVTTKQNFWNQAKINVLNNVNANKQATTNASSDKKKTTAFTWSNQIKLLKQQKEQEENKAIAQHKAQVDGKLNQIKNFINNYEQVLTVGNATSRNKSLNRDSSSDSLRSSISTKRLFEKTQTQSTLSMIKSDSKLFSPVNRQPSSKLLTSPQTATPLRVKNNANQIQSDSKINKSSSNIFEYVSKENGKSYIEKSRKELYTRCKNSVDEVSKYFGKIKNVNTQEFKI